jgi:ubiquinone/menaquinone biosynthesis C-methylase UbiE
MASANPRDLNRREFARQSPSFEQAGSVFGDRSILEWIAANVPVASGAQILDVAGGTGHVGRHLVGEGGHAVVVDLTDEMLAEGMRAVRAQGRTDVTFVRGDATDLPFLDGQFDVVVCRFALHHLDDPEHAVAEMARVRAPGGSVTVLDRVSGGERHDELERVRDPSHTRALGEEELRALVAAHASGPERIATRELAEPVETWLEQSRTPDEDRERIRAALSAEADGGAPTGLRAARTADGALTITHRFVLAGG